MDAVRPVAPRLARGRVKGCIRSFPLTGHLSSGVSQVHRVLYEQVQFAPVLEHERRSISVVVLAHGPLDQGKEVQVEQDSEIELAYKKAGQEARTGTVTALSGSMLTVTSGQESMFVPGPGQGR